MQGTLATAQRLSSAGAQRPEVLLPAAGQLDVGTGPLLLPANRTAAAQQRRGEPRRVGGTRCQIAQDRDVPRQGRQRGEGGVEVRPGQGGDVEVIGTSHVADRPPEGGDPFTAKPSAADGERENRL